MKMVNNFCLVVTFLYLTTTSRAHVESHGMWRVFSVTCDSESEKKCQSESLEKISATSEEQTNVQIDIKISQIQLNTNLSFTNLASLIITGEPGLSIIKCTANSHTSAGIILNNISGTVTLSNLKLTLCGLQIKDTFDRGLQTTYSSALTIAHCRNIELNGLVIEKSRGKGLTILNQEGGRMNITSAAFKQNKLSHGHTHDTESVLGGGGVFVQLDHSQHSAPITLLFDNCSFECNSAHTKHYNYLYTDGLGQAHEGYGEGGGAYVLISGGLTNVIVSFVGCKFINNKAFLGGGLAVRTLEEKDRRTENITVEVTNSIFEQNGCVNNSKYTATNYGGGAYFTLRPVSYLDESNIADSHYIVKNVQFIENCAELGGGVYFSNSNNHDSNSMLFDNCTFRGNKAHMGSAVILAPGTFFRRSTGHSVRPRFLDCQFLENFANYQESSKSQKDYGVGTVYVSSYDIQFQGYNHFEHNCGSALYVINGIVDFQNSNVSFTSNTGLQGGAMALIGSSTMIVGPNNYEFINNTATYKGGAIYVLLIDKTDFTASRRCFIQYRDDENSREWKSNITFTGNKAKFNGHAIFSTSLHPCQVVDNGTANQSEYTLVDISEVFRSGREHITFDNDTELQRQIATDGALLTRDKTTPLMIVPGKKFHHSVKIHDDLGHIVKESTTV